MPEEEKKNWLGPYIPQGSFLREMVQQVKLAYNLMIDGRVHPLLKLLPIAAVVYLVSPIDFIPDALVGIGQLDDLAVLWFGLWLFFELAPPEVVREHLRRLVQRGTWQSPPPTEPPATPPEPDGEVVDGTFIVKDEEDKPQ